MVIKHIHQGGGCEAIVRTVGNELMDEEVHVHYCSEKPVAEVQLKSGLTKKVCQEHADKWRNWWGTVSVRDVEWWGGDMLLDLFSEREWMEIEYCRCYAEEYQHGTSGHLIRMLVAKLADLLEEHYSEGE